MDHPLPGFLIGGLSWISVTFITLRCGMVLPILPNVYHRRNISCLSRCKLNYLRSCSTIILPGSIIIFQIGSCSDMADEKKRCENCWVMVNRPRRLPQLQSHLSGERNRHQSARVLSRGQQDRPRRTISRPFKFITVLPAVVHRHPGVYECRRNDIERKHGCQLSIRDVIAVHLVSLLIAGVLIFIDYLIRD